MTIDFDKWTPQKWDHMMKRQGYVKVKNLDSEDGRWMIKGEWTPVYVREILSSKEQYEAAEALKEKLEKS